MFKSSEKLRHEAAQRSLDRVASSWRNARTTWFDGTPESIEARLAETNRVLTVARSGFTPAHLGLTIEAENARRELLAAKHRLLNDFLDDGARAVGYHEAAYYDEGADGLSADQEGPRRFDSFPPGGDEISSGGYRYQYDPNTKQYLKNSPMGGSSGIPLEPGQEYTGGEFKPHYPDDWDGLSSDQEGPRRFDMRGLVNEEHPYHADEEGRLYGYDPVTQQHLKVSPMGGLEGTPEEPGQQYTDYLPSKYKGHDLTAHRTAGMEVAWEGKACPDCGMAIANGDDSGASDEWSWDKMGEGISKLPGDGHPIIDCPDCESGDHGFERGPCDLCGSPYDGNFHRAVTLGPTGHEGR